MIPFHGNAESARRTAAAMAAQSLRPAIAMAVLLVDDGSPRDASAVSADPMTSDHRTIRLEQNSGRCVARNIGASEANSDVILFIDADCTPLGPDLVERHLDAIASGAVASTGDIHGAPGTFWGDCESRASRGRNEQHAAGLSWAGTTANLCVRRDAFEQVGRFDESFSGYGFEDRDLLIRLSRRGEIAWPQGAGVLHRGEATMQSVSRKLRSAGAVNAPLFARKHPLEYRSMPYARIDVRDKPVRRRVVRMLTPTIAPLADGIDWSVAHLPVPWFVYRACVKILSALSFAAGSASADHGRSARRAMAPGSERGGE